MSARIERITIEAVRGVGPSLQVALSGKTYLLRGDNGSGKSSIVEALRWALCGAPTSAGTALPDEYFAHRGPSAAASPRVLVELSQVGTVDSTGARTDDTGGRFRDACVRANPFFRRAELQDLLAVAPVDRFKYLKSFFDLQAADVLIESLAEKRKALAASAKQHKAALTERTRHALRTLKAPNDASEDADLLAVARDCAQQLGIRITEGCSWAELISECTNAAAKAGSPEAAVRRRSLANAHDRALALVPPDHPATALAPLRAAEERLAGEDISALLKSALTHVESHPQLRDCPVCEQPVQPSQLAAQLRARLAVLEEVRRATVDVETSAAAWRSFLETLDVLEAEASCGTSEPSTHLRGRALLEELERSAEDGLASSILGRLQRIRSEIARELDSLRDVDRAADLEALRVALCATASEIPELDRLQAEHASAERLQRSVSAIEKALTAARKDVFENEVTAVQGIFERYYGRVHPEDDPSEVTRAPKLKVTNHGSGRAELLGVFLGKTVGDPRHLYSDGHLDTVALCLFLALRRARASRPGDPRIMVLDDVILSIDLEHAERLLALIRDEFLRDHQIVIVSHSELFIRQCQQYLQGSMRQDINRWTPTDGPRIVGHVAHVDELKRVLSAAGSNEALANALRPVLDDFLHEACDAFDVALRSDRYRPITMGEQWPALRKKLRELARKGVVSADVELLSDKVGEPSFLRNALGAHLNEWALSVPLGTVQALVEAVLELVEALQCSTCSAICRPRTPDLPSPNFACRCPKGQAPTIRRRSKDEDCQTPAASSVESA